MKGVIHTHTHTCVQEGEEIEREGSRRELKLHFSWYKINAYVKLKNHEKVG